MRLRKWHKRLTPLHRAVSDDDERAVVDILLGHSGSKLLDSFALCFKLTPVMLAVYSNLLRPLSLLAAAGASLSDTDLDGTTPLVEANAHRNDIEITRVLVAALRTSRPVDGISAMGWAARYGDSTCLTACALSPNADVSAIDMVHCVFGQCGASAQFMIGIGCEPRVRDSEVFLWLARPPNRHALGEPSAKFVSVLLRAGYDPSPVDDTKNDPLSVMRECVDSPADHDVIRELRRHKIARAREMLPGDELGLPSSIVNDLMQFII